MNPGALPGLADTVCAAATAPGNAGIGVIRVSGPHAVEIVGKIFRAASALPLSSVPPRQAVFGVLVDPFTGRLLDQAVCTAYRAPRSYTGENMVEVSAHGNPRILAGVLEVLARCGARAAGRGEFTKRAFLNGKLDLTQAEGVMDAVGAVTEEGVDSALSQVSGKLGGFLKGLRAEVLSILSPIEAGIDFPEEEVPEVGRPLLLAQIRAAALKIEKTLQGARRGRILREGFSGVIAGKPNVGKSSLLNALLREGRAIVTDIPGTTRDTIEEWVDVRGIPMRLVDTAGIRVTGDPVERMGISRSKEALARGDLILVVLDRSTPLEPPDFELLEEARRKNSVVILNKMDLEGPLSPADVRKIYPGPLVPLSLLKNESLEPLEGKIADSVLAPPLSGETEIPLITRLRHQECLERAREFLREAARTLEENLPLDLAAGDLRAAAESVGRITGESYTEDLLEKIFNEFCIGK